MSPSRLPSALGIISPQSLVTGLSVIAISWCAPPAPAADYQINPRVELGGGYNDNVTLLTGSNQISAADVLADARVEFLAQEPNWQWRVTPELRGNWYSGHSELNSNGEILDLAGERRGARYTLALDGYGISQSLITNYLPTANIGGGLGTSQPGTTLATPASLRENLGYLRPSYEFAMTQRSSLELNLEYTQASYSEQNQGYTNYHDLGGAAGVVLKATPTGSVVLQATGASFQPDAGRTARTYSAQVQWEAKFSPTQQYYLRLGGARTDLSGSLAGGEPAAANSTTAVTGGAGVQWTYPLTEIFVDLTRDVEPTGAGYVVYRDQLRLRVARRFTPRLAGFLGGRAIRDDPVPGSVGPSITVQRYFFGTLGFEWRVARKFSVIGAYNFTDYHHTGTSAEANAVRLSLVYEPHRAENGPAITIGY